MATWRAALPHSPLELTGTFNEFLEHGGDSSSSSLPSSVPNSNLFFHPKGSSYDVRRLLHELEVSNLPSVYSELSLAFQEGSGQGTDAIGWGVVAVLHRMLHKGYRMLHEILLRLPQMFKEIMEGRERHATEFEAVVSESLSLFQSLPLSLPVP